MSTSGRSLHRAAQRVAREDRLHVIRPHEPERNVLMSFTTAGIDDADTAQLRAHSDRLRELRRCLAQQTRFGAALMALTTEQLRVVNAALARKQRFLRSRPAPSSPRSRS